jgi:XTP/dITP diphosphohydrolase
MQKIVLASSNKGKINEFSTLFVQFDYDVIPQQEFAISDAEETGLSFVENAIIKARHASKISGLPAIADDSGLMIDALNGEPGIYSARYAGNEKNALANINKVLLQLQQVSAEKRSARFVCCLALLQHVHDPLPIVCQGILEGVITTAAQGQRGFGYDPIFFIPEQNCTAAELTPEIKNQISHRAKAMQQLKTLLQSESSVL